MSTKCCTKFHVYSVRKAFTGKNCKFTLSCCTIWGSKTCWDQSVGADNLFRKREKKSQTGKDVSFIFLWKYISIWIHREIIADTVAWEFSDKCKAARVAQIFSQASHKDKSILTKLRNTLFHVSEDNNNLFCPPSSCLESLTSYVSPFSGYWALVSGGQADGQEICLPPVVANRDLWSAPYALKLVPACDKCNSKYQSATSLKMHRKVVNRDLWSAPYALELVLPFDKCDFNGEPATFFGNAKKSKYFLIYT